MTITPDPHPSDPRHRRWRPLTAALLLILLISACSGSDMGDDSAADTAEPVSGAPTVSPDDGERTDGDALAIQGDVADEADADQDAADADAPRPVDTTPTAVTGERIIKEGTVTLEVQPGDFDRTFAQVITRAQALGGHVSGSSSSSDPAPGQAGEDGQVLVSGQVTVRVPVRSFEDLLTAVGEAGPIVDRTITSQDVTAEFTDLESRRRHLQAQERFYLGLLEQSQTVADAIAVQQQLDGVQRQIEEITGRLNLLGDRTSFSTLTVRIHELGAASPEVVGEDEPGGLAPYLSDAEDVLVSTVGAIIVVGTFLLPFAVMLLVGGAIWRGVRPGRRDQRPHPADDAPALTTPAHEAPAPEPVDVGAPVGVGAPTGRPAPGPGGGGVDDARSDG